MSDPLQKTTDIRDVMNVLWRRKLLLVTPWLVALLVGVVAAFMLKPVYYSRVTMVLERAQQFSGRLGEMIPGSRAGEQAEIMREQVKSSVFLRSVISASGVLEDEATRAWANEEAPQYPGLDGDERLEQFMVDYLRNNVAVRRTRGNVFQVTVGDYNPARAQKLTDAVAEQFVLSSKAEQLEALREAQDFSVEQQQVYKKRLEESEERLESARRSALASTVSGSAVNAANVSNARSLLEQAQLEVSEQRRRAASLRDQLSGQTQPGDVDAISDGNVSALEGQLVSLERQLASSSLTGSGNAASVRLRLSRKSAELEGTLTANAARTFPSLPDETRRTLVRYRMALADQAAREAGMGFLSGEIAAYEREITSGPDRDTNIARLQQEVEANRALYNAFLSQAAANQIAEAYENAKLSGRFTILEPANYPMSAGKPNRPLLIVLAFLVGGVIGVGSVLVVEQHDQSVKNADEVESLLGLPVLGVVPRVEELDRSRRRSRAPAGAPGLPEPRDEGLLHRLKMESPLGLEFRRIYLKLTQTQRTLPHTMMVTSSTRGEGKTTTSASLAITLARELREKMLVVDFDLRSPKLHRALGLPGSSWGLSQMLQQRHFDERFIRGTVIPHMDFLGAGKSERPAAELIDSQGVEWFLREAAQRYSFVLVDAAPNLAVPDPLIIGREVEGVVFVIRAGTTIRKAAEYGVRVQREACDNVMGVLLNDLGEVLPQYYGYRYNSYGYEEGEVAGGDS